MINSLYFLLCFMIIVKILIYVFRVIFFMLFYSEGKYNLLLLLKYL